MSILRSLLVIDITCFQRKFCYLSLDWIQHRMTMTSHSDKIFREKGVKFNKISALHLYF